MKSTAQLPSWLLSLCKAKIISQIIYSKQHLFNLCYKYSYYSSYFRKSSGMVLCKYENKITQKLTNIDQLSIKYFYTSK